MAKLQVTLIDSGGTPQTGQTVRIKIAGTSTIVASTVGSDTGGTATIVDNGDGTYITDDSYSTYLTSGDLVTGEYDIYKGASVEIEAYPHVDPADVTGALQAASNLSDLGNAATARTNLGVAIGSDVQAYSADLDGAEGLFSSWDAVGVTYPFVYWNTTTPGFTSASGFRTLLGLGEAALLDEADIIQKTYSETNDALPTASSSYVGQFYVRNSSTQFGIWVCVRTGSSTYEWREVFIDDGATGSEEAYYTYGGA